MKYNLIAYLETEVIRLHDKGRATGDKFYRELADEISAFLKEVKYGR